MLDTADNDKRSGRDDRTEQRQMVLAFMAIWNSPDRHAHKQKKMFV